MVLIIASIAIYNIYTVQLQKNQQLFETEAAPEVEYSAISKNFTFDVLIEIGKGQKNLKDESNYTTLDYTINVENMSSNVIKNLQIKVFPDKKIESFIKSGSLSFGNKGQKVNLNIPNSIQEDYKYKIHNSLLLYNLNNMQIQQKEELYEALESPIKVIIQWDKGRENLLITEDKIKIITYLAP